MIGLDLGRFTKDLDTHARALRIAKKVMEVEDLGVTGTPATVINGRFVSGAQPYEAFKMVVAPELVWPSAAFARGTVASPPRHRRIRTLRSTVSEAGS